MSGERDGDRSIAAPEPDVVSAPSSDRIDDLAGLRAQLDSIDALDLDARVAAFEGINVALVRELAQLDEY